MELNDLLMAKDSLAAGTRPYVNSTQFDTSYSVPTGAINYTNLTKDARPYDAVVSLSGELGTFKNIQEAVNHVRTLGGGRVLIKNGTYKPTETITLFSNILVYGESTYNTYIDFSNVSGNGFNVGACNYSGILNMSIFNCDVNISVTGTSNVFENLYMGSASYDFYINSCRKCRFYNIECINSKTDAISINGPDIINGDYNRYENIKITNPNHSGMLITGSYNSTFNNIAVVGGTINGFEMKGNSIDRNLFLNCQANDNAKHGFYLEDLDRNIFSNCLAFSNGSNGFDLFSGGTIADTAPADIMLLGCQITDNKGYGIAAGTHCSNILVDDLYMVFNTAGTISDPGTKLTIGYTIP